MADGYGLSEEDRTALKDLVAWWRQQPPSRPPHGSTEESGDNSQPETQIVRTPIGGIPGSPTARNDLEYAECQLFALEQSGGAFRLVEMTGFTERVYNLSSAAIDGEAYIQIYQDRQGYWWASCNDCLGPDEVFTGTGTGTALPTFDPLTCCDGDTIPTTLFATITDPDLDCACLRGVTVELTWTGATVPIVWSGIVAVGCGDGLIKITLSCLAGTSPYTVSLQEWNGASYVVAGTPDGEVATWSCDPFLVDETIILFGDVGYCPLTSQLRITITE